MKKYSKIIYPAIFLVTLIIGVAVVFYQLSQDEVLDIGDVLSSVRTYSQYFIPTGILLVAIIVAIIVFRKKGRNFNYWLRGESVIALLLSLIITVNIVIFGPMASLLNLTSGALGKISDDTFESSAKVTNAIADEGIVLLKNDDQYLPLNEEVKKLNVFGWASTNPVYGGTGSGNVDTTNAIDLLEGLENNGFELNTALKDFYVDYREDRPNVGMRSQDWTLPEPKASEYSNQLLDNAKNFSDTAVVVIARVGGEGADLPTDMLGEGIDYEGNEGDFKQEDHYLQLSQTELELVELVNSNFENVIIVVNAANSLELGWIEDYENIKSTIWMAGPGTTGFDSLGKILNGSVNPSGRTVDTYVYDLKTTPTFNNFGHFQYEDSEYTFVNYVEGIYVGYKFYETFFENDKDQYDEVVQFPFGYGLSFTEFEQNMSNLTIDNNGIISFDVTVQNVGEAKGKDVIQVYSNPPYENGEIEKAAANLIAFEKTTELVPGESQTISFSFSQEELASYDSSNSGHYVLDAGEYALQIKENSNILIDEKIVTIEQKMVFDTSNPRETDQIAAVNQFDFVEGEVTYLSRKNNFENYEEVVAAPEIRPLTDKEKDGLMNTDNYVLENDEDAEMPKTGAKNGKVLSDYVGVDYDDESWNELLDQLTVAEMSRMISYGGYQTLAIESVEKVQVYDFDGPAGLSSFFMRFDSTAFPSATMIAATWNKDLAYARGEAVGQEASELGVSGWYAPGMNIHRNAFAGRNFEYYSEDPVLSGAMAAREVSGAASKGVYSFLKHFVLNDQETNRNNLILTWSNEQALREIYLRPFEDAVKDGGATAMMSAFNYIGNRWAGASSELLNTVLRDEWGFRGFVLTDYFGGYGNMNADMAIRNGNDVMLTPNGGNGATLEDTTSATAVNAMRTATHNVLYTVVNSRAYEDKDKIEMKLPWENSVSTIIMATFIMIAILQIFLIGYFLIFYKNNNQNRPGEAV